MDEQELAEALGGSRGEGHRVSPSTICKILASLGFSLQAPQKQKEGKQHPDKNGQFDYSNDRAIHFHEAGLPVISVDRKKKELVGDFRGSGREWMPKGEPLRVNVHDFPSQAVGKAVPYGIYDIFNYAGRVNVGIDHDTAQFAANSILLWWDEMGFPLYPNAKELLVIADSGVSNSPSTRPWKTAVQDLADRTGLTIQISHLPPGTSKWNKIEHRVFAHITRNWRGRPLTSFMLSPS